VSSDVLRVVNHFFDAPQQRLHGDIIELNHKSVACCNSPVHIQTLVAEYRNPKQRHASVNSFLCTQQSTVRNEQSQVRMFYRTHSTHLEIQLHQAVQQTYTLWPTMYLTVYISVSLSICLSVCIYLPNYFSIHQSIYFLSIHP